MSFKVFYCNFSNRLPEDEPSGSKRAEDIKKIRKLKFVTKKCAFRWFILYNYITMYGAKT
jgi:hypothetical protein